jgi:hypothetical protein
MVVILYSVKSRIVYGRNSLKDCLSNDNSDDVIVSSFRVQHI